MGTRRRKDSEDEAQLFMLRRFASACFAMEGVGKSEIAWSPWQSSARGVSYHLRKSGDGSSSGTAKFLE
eukprot:5189972-Pleurochrysis_carterae.AAC.3